MATTTSDPWADAHLSMKLQVLLPDAEERDELQTIVNDFYSEKNVRELIQNMKKLFKKEEQMSLFDDIRPFIPNEHQMEFNVLAPYTQTRIRVIRLRRKGNAPLGFSIRGGCEHGTGIFVSDIQTGTEAERQGLKVGDQIVRINGFNIDRAIHEEVLSLLKSKPGVVLKVKSVGMIPVKDQAPSLLTELGLFENTSVKKKDARRLRKSLSTPTLFDPDSMDNEDEPHPGPSGIVTVAQVERAPEEDQLIHRSRQSSVSSRKEQAKSANWILNDKSLYSNDFKVNVFVEQPVNDTLEFESFGVEGEDNSVKVNVDASELPSESGSNKSNPLFVDQVETAGSPVSDGVQINGDSGLSNGSSQFENKIELQDKVTERPTEGEVSETEARDLSELYAKPIKTPNGSKKSKETVQEIVSDTNPDPFYESIEEVQEKVKSFTVSPVIVESNENVLMGRQPPILVTQPTEEKDDTPEDVTVVNNPVLQNVLEKEIMNVSKESHVPSLEQNENIENEIEPKPSLELNESILVEREPKPSLELNESILEEKEPKPSLEQNENIQNEIAPKPTLEQNENILQEKQPDIVVENDLTLPSYDVPVENNNINNFEETPTINCEIKSHDTTDHFTTIPEDADLKEQPIMYAAVPTISDNPDEGKPNDSNLTPIPEDELLNQENLPNGIEDTTLLNYHLETPARTRASNSESERINAAFDELDSVLDTDTNQTIATQPDEDSKSFTIDFDSEEIEFEKKLREKILAARANWVEGDSPGPNNNINKRIVASFSPAARQVAVAGGGEKTEAKILVDDLVGGGKVEEQRPHDDSTTDANSIGVSRIIATFNSSEKEVQPVPTNNQSGPRRGKLKIPSIFT